MYCRSPPCLCKLRTFSSALAYTLAPCRISVSHVRIPQVYGTAKGDDTQYGLFYGGGVKLLACQAIGVGVIFAWVVVNMTLFFGIFRAFGKLRITAEDEQVRCQRFLCANAYVSLLMY